MMQYHSVYIHACMHAHTCTAQCVLTGADLTSSSYVPAHRWYATLGVDGTMYGIPSVHTQHHLVSAEYNNKIMTL